MALIPIPPSPNLDDDISSTGGFTFISATTLGGAQALWTPTAQAAQRQFIYLAVGSISAATVTLSIAVNGVHVFDQSIPTKSGLNVVFDWEEFRAPVGLISCWASVTNVLSYKGPHVRADMP